MVRLFSDDYNISRRESIILGCFGIAALASAAQLVNVQFIHGEEYRAAAVNSRTRADSVPARRGTIYDRNGNILAASVDAVDVYVNPREITDVEQASRALAEVLGGEAKDYVDLLTIDTTFVYIQRQAEVEQGDRLREKEIAGLHLINSVKRVYPYGSVGGQVIGYVNVDGEGISGLELYYNDILSGTDGSYSRQMGLYDAPIPGGVDYDIEPIDGEDIVVSLDVEMQSFLEERVAKEVERVEGADGTGVLMDGSTGEILAICSTPYFDCTHPEKSEIGSESVKGIVRAFEPGSVFKTPAMVAVLETGAVTPDTVVECPVSLEADEYEVSDAHERPACDMTARQILADSSNVGIILLVKEYLGFSSLYKRVGEFGFTSTTGVDYPGESAGYLAEDIDSWSIISKYNLSFGQGVMVTPMQLCRFYGALANGGVACTPHFLISKPQTGEVAQYDTETIITDGQVLADTISMLESVVTDGTGKDARVEGFTVAGKTGTAEYADPETGGYVEGRYNLDFVGFLPEATVPLVCFTSVTEVAYETLTTALFSDIMTEAVARYRIAQL